MLLCVQIAGLFTAVALLAHLAACLFYYMALVNGSGPGTWVGAMELTVSTWSISESLLKAVQSVRIVCTHPISIAVPPAVSLSHVC